MAAQRAQERSLAWPAGSRLAPQDDASGVPQGGVYARAGDVVAVIVALGVDAEQHLDAAPRSLGHLGRGTPAANKAAPLRGTASGRSPRLWP